MRSIVGSTGGDGRSRRAHFIVYKHKCSNLKRFRSLDVSGCEQRTALSCDAAHRVSCRACGKDFGVSERLPVGLKWAAGAPPSSSSPGWRMVGPGRRCYCAHLWVFFVFNAWPAWMAKPYWRTLWIESFSNLKWFVGVTTPFSFIAKFLTDREELKENAAWQRFHQPLTMYFHLVLGNIITIIIPPFIYFLFLASSQEGASKLSFISISPGNKGLSSVVEYFYFFFKDKVLNHSVHILTSLK